MPAEFRGDLNGPATALPHFWSTPWEAAMPLWRCVRTGKRS